MPPLHEEVSNANKSGWIGVDLDGTLANYNGFISYDHIGEPIIPMVNLVKYWLSIGRDVRIFTARIASPPSKYHTKQDVINIINAWLIAQFDQTLPITNQKDWQCLEIWDDRAVQVKFNEGIPTIFQRSNAPLPKEFNQTIPFSKEEILDAGNAVPEIPCSTCTTISNPDKSQCHWRPRCGSLRYQSLLSSILKFLYRSIS